MARIKKKKKSEPTLTREERICAALDDLRAGTFRDIAKAGRAHNVPRSTLSSRFRGVHTSAKEAHAHRQKLSVPVENALVDWCIFLGVMAIPYTRPGLEERAQVLAGPGSEIGINWYRRFIERHADQLKFNFAYELDPKRASGFNRTVMRIHFESFTKLMTDYHVPAAHLWNMDEKGLQRGGGRSTSRQKHLFAIVQKSCYKFKHDSLELTTVIECGSADGVAMKPVFVHQPGDVGLWWEDDRIGCCVASEKGWTSEDICESWFTKVFIPTAMERRVSDAPVVLLLDGHGSHITTRIRDLAFQNKVFLFCLPPKTSHKTQPLDVGVFNLVQHAWKKECEESVLRGDPFTKGTAIANYLVAREAGLRPEVIVDAWRRSGHYPINPDIFTDADYAPSKVSSIIAQLPPSFPGVGHIAPEDHCAPNNVPNPVDAPADPTTPADETPETERQTSPPVGEHYRVPAANQNDTGQALDSEDLAGDPGPLEAFHVPQPRWAHYFGQSSSLTAKEQAALYRNGAEKLWQDHMSIWDQLQSLYAHSVLLKHENGKLRLQLQARAAPKRTKPEAAAASKVQKHGFLTAPEAKEAFYAELAKEEERRQAGAKKQADKEAKAKEVESGRARLMLDSEYRFSGTLLSYKNTSHARLGDLAASLALPFSGLTRAAIFAGIESHFEAHPDLKSHPRYSNLFASSSRSRVGHTTRAEGPPTLQDGTSGEVGDSEAAG